MIYRAICRTANGFVGVPVAFFVQEIGLQRLQQLLFSGKCYRKFSATFWRSEISGVGFIAVFPELEMRL